MATERFFQKGAAKSVGVFLTLLTGRYEGHQPIDLTREKIKVLASKLEFEKPLQGFARLVISKKPGGKTRSSLNFSGNVRAAFVPVRDALIALGYRNPLDYNSNGRGRHGLVREIGAKISSGMSHWLVFDIKNCFGSIEQKHLTDVILPEKVVRYCVYVNRYIHIKSLSDDTKAVRSGLPFGSPVSGIIAGALIGRKLQQSVGDNCWGRLFADDGIVGACTPFELDAAEAGLKGQFEGDQTGPLVFKTFEKTERGRGFEFLGYWIQWDDNSQHFKLKLNPSKSSYYRRNETIRNKLAKDVQNIDISECFEKVDVYAICWRKSFAANPITTLDLEDARAHCAVVASDILDGSYGKKFIPTLLTVGG